MSMINMRMKHGRSLEEAKAALAQTVREIQTRFAPLLHRIQWDPQSTKVRLEGTGFWAELWVDPLEAHGTGDISMFAGLFGGGLNLNQLFQSTFENALPRGPKPSD